MKPIVCVLYSWECVCKVTHFPVGKQLNCERPDKWKNKTKKSNFGSIWTRSWFVFVSWIGRSFQVVFVLQAGNLIFTIGSTYICLLFQLCTWLKLLVLLSCAANYNFSRILTWISVFCLESTFWSFCSVLVNSWWLWSRLSKFWNLPKILQHHFLCIYLQNLWVIANASQYHLQTARRTSRHEMPNAPVRRTAAGVESVSRGNDWRWILWMLFLLSFQRARWPCFCVLHWSRWSRNYSFPKQWGKLHLGLLQNLLQQQQQ